MGSTAPTKLRGRAYAVALFLEIRRQSAESIELRGEVDISRISMLLEDAMADASSREHLASFCAQYLSCSLLGLTPDLPEK